MTGTTGSVEGFCEEDERILEFGGYVGGGSEVRVVKGVPKLKPGLGDRFGSNAFGFADSADVTPPGWGGHPFDVIDPGLTLKKMVLT